MGTFYCRHIGVISSKGEYVFHLDSDDMILDSDVFSSVTNIADVGNFDIITFQYILAHHSANLLNAKINGNILWNNLILYQPEMGLFPFRPGKEYGKYIIFESFIWLNCVKTRVYQKISQKIGEKRYTRYHIYEEDRTDIYALRNTAQSMKYIGKFGYLKIRTPSSMTGRHIPEEEKIISKLYFIDICIDFSKESYESKKVLVYFFTYLMELKAFVKVLKSNEYHKKFFISCMNRILNCKYFVNEDKNEIKKRVAKFDFS